MSVIFTSDTHIFHKNIIGYCDRPFEGVWHMRNELIRRYNEKVTSQDTTYLLGDFALGAGIDRWTEFMSCLNNNGNIILIKGNHDSNKVLPLFREVHAELYLQTEFGVLWLNHFPLGKTDYRNRLGYTRPKASQPYDYALCGHSHNKPETRFDAVNRCLDVGVDGNNFYPWTIEEVVREFV